LGFVFAEAFVGDVFFFLFRFGVEEEEEATPALEEEVGLAFGSNCSLTV